jgi:hypothetical protein
VVPGQGDPVDGRDGREGRVIVVRWSRESAARTVITLGLGGIGAAAGFSHTHDWAVRNGQVGWLAWADAVVIECMAVVAGFEIKRDRSSGRVSKRLTLPVVVLAVSFVVQMAAQVSAAPLTPAGWLLAATPALGFLVVVKLVMRRPPPGPELESVSVVAAERCDGPVVPAPVDRPELPAPAEVEIPMTRSLMWLPVAVRDQVAARAREVVGAGRELTVDDVRDVVRQPEAQLAGLVDELNSAIAQ